MESQHLCGHCWDCSHHWKGNCFGDGLEQNEIGYLPQQTAVQKDFPASVREIILSGCQNKCGIRPFYSRKEKQVASEMMENCR